jgi:hypothetical protein
MLSLEQFGEFSRRALLIMHPLEHLFVLLRYVVLLQTTYIHGLPNCVMLSCVTATGVAPTSSLPASYETTETTTSDTATTIAPGLYANYCSRFLTFGECSIRHFVIPLEALYTHLHIVRIAYPTI